MKFRKLAKILNISLLSLVFVFSSFIPGVLAATAAPTYDFMKNSGVSATAQGTGHANQKIFNGAPGSIDSGISSMITLILSFLGVIFLVLMIYGGVLWMIAQGNEKNVDQAKSIITDAIIGLIIVASAYAISYFVLNVAMQNLTA
ncbi:MAG: hypothetical protein WCK37_04225 [Candidatus Falkowbacteria bacterium]